MWANKTATCTTSTHTQPHAPQAVMDHSMDELVKPPCNLGSKCPAVWEGEGRISGKNRAGRVRLLVGSSRNYFQDPFRMLGILL